MTPKTDAIVAELRFKPRACSIRLADHARFLELALARRDALLRRCLMPLNMLAVSDSDPLYKQLEADVKAELGDSHE